MGDGRCRIRWGGVGHAGAREKQTQGDLDDVGSLGHKQGESRLLLDSVTGGKADHLVGSHKSVLCVGLVNE